MFTFGGPPAPVATFTSAINALPAESQRPNTTALPGVFQAVAKVEPAATIAGRPRVAFADNGDLLALSAPVPLKMRAWTSLVFVFSGSLKSAAKPPLTGATAVFTAKPALCPDVRSVGPATSVPDAVVMRLPI